MILNLLWTYLGCKDTCAACHKTRWFVRKRRYLVEKVSPIPIESEGKLCRKCAKNIGKLTKTI